MNPVMNWLRVLTENGLAEGNAVRSGDLAKAQRIADARIAAMAFADQRYDRSADEGSWCFAACFSYSIERVFI